MAGYFIRRQANVRGSVIGRSLNADSDTNDVVSVYVLLARQNVLGAREVVMSLFW